jgi:hypothetical protein
MDPFTQAAQLLKIAAVWIPRGRQRAVFAALVSIQDRSMSSSKAVTGCRATVRFFVVAGFALLGACSQELPPRTALELMQDPAVRDAVLLRCNQLQGAALRDAECRNVREAVDRLAAEEQENETEEAQQEVTESFEKAREARRAREEHERRRREAAEKPADPYTMPLVPEQPAESIPTAAVMSAASLPES